MPPQPPPARPADPPYPACVPIISDGVVRLRAHRPEDAPRIVEQCQNAASQAFLPLPSPYHLSDARDFLDKVADGWDEEWGAREWAITDESDLFLGSANLHDRSPFRAEVGFGLHPDARGRGLASAAVRLLADRAFAEGALALRWRAVAGNWASRRVAWDCGFDAPTTVSAAGLDGGGHPIDEWHAVLRPGSPLRPRTPDITAAVEGARVSLRDFRDDDVQWLPWDVDARAPGFVDREMPTRDGYREWLAEQRSRACHGESLQWAVADRRTDELMGAIVLSQLSEPRTAGRGVLGFWLLQRWRGRDLMTEAVDLAIDSAFASATSGQRLPIRALKAYVDIDDEASARVVRAVGFTQCGRERAAYDHGDSAPSDALVFEVLATDDRGARRLRPLVPPVIETQRLRMRPWRDSDRPGPEDGPDEAAVRWMPAGAQPGPGDFDEWLSRHRRSMDEQAGLTWCLAYRESDRALGSMGVFHRGDGPIDFDAEIGYWLVPRARGRGLTSEALARVIAHAFAPVSQGGLGLARVHAGTDDDNLASQAVLRGAGLREWGRDRQAWRRSDGTLCDGVYFELLATDAR